MSPTYGYSITGLDKDKSAIASVRDAQSTPKKAREVCHAIKGKNLQKAKDYLERVLAFKEPIPFKRHKGHQAHRKGKGFGPGRYPVKSVKVVLSLLKDLTSHLYWHHDYSTRECLSPQHCSRKFSSLTT